MLDNIPGGYDKDTVRIDGIQKAYDSDVIVTDVCFRLPQMLVGYQNYFKTPT